MSLEDQSICNIKGPMGLGLNLDLNGHNVVFAGGTAILIFLDLIASLVL